VFLLLNGLTARCYLWQWLGVNTAGGNCDLKTSSRQVQQ